MEVVANGPHGLPGGALIPADSLADRRLNGQLNKFEKQALAHTGVVVASGYGSTEREKMQKRQAFIESGVLAADRESECRLQAGEGDSEQQGDVGVVVEASKPELKKPPMFKVVLLNDDYTPMEFVIHILEKFFGMNREKATQIMLVVHTEGAAVVGIFPRDIAETKSEQVNLYAQENSHPLMSRIEITD